MEWFSNGLCHRIRVMDNKVLNRSDILRWGWFAPWMIGCRQFYHPLHSQIHTFPRRSVNTGVIQQSCEDMRSCIVSFRAGVFGIDNSGTRIELKTVPNCKFDGSIVRRFERRAHDRVILSANWHSWCVDMIGHARLWVGEPLESGVFIGCSPDNSGMNRSRESHPANSLN